MVDTERLKEIARPRGYAGIRRNEIIIAANEHVKDELLDICRVSYDKKALEYQKKISFMKGAQWSDAHPKSTWRDAAKDAPKNDDNVIIFIHGKVCEGYFNVYDRYWYCREFGYIDTPKYWMPMPELPKE